LFSDFASNHPFSISNRTSFNFQSIFASIGSASFEVYFCFWLSNGLEPFAKFYQIIRAKNYQLHLFYCLFIYVYIFTYSKFSDVLLPESKSVFISVFGFVVFNKNVSKNSLFTSNTFKIDHNFSSRNFTRIKYLNGLGFFCIFTVSYRLEVSLQSYWLNKLILLCSTQ